MTKEEIHARLYERNAAYRFVLDKTEDGSIVDLNQVYELLKPDNPDAPTPEQYRADRNRVQGDGFAATFYPFRLESTGEVFADHGIAMDYLLKADDDVLTAISRIALLATRENPARMAAGAGELGGMVAVMAKVGQGSDPDDVKAELVADIMEQTDDLPPEEQARIVATTRANVASVRFGTRPEPDA